MRFSLFHLPALLMLAGVLAGLAPAGTQAAEVPEGKEGLSITNAPRRGRKSLQQLEEDLSKSLQSFSPRNSLDGMMAPAQPVPRPSAPAPSRRAKDEDKRDNWKLDLESLNRELSGDDPFKLPGDRSSKRKSSWGNTTIDDGYTSRNGKSADSSLFGEDARTGKRKTSDNGSDNSDDSILPGRIRDSERTLRKVLEDSPAGNATFSGGFMRGSISDPFGLGDRGPSPADLEAHRSYMQEYRNLLNQPSATPAWNPAQPGDMRQPQTQTLNPVSAGSYTPAARTPEITPGNVNSFLKPQRVPDVNATVLNQWNPLYTPPQVEPAKRVAPTTPVTEYQRRKF